MIMPCFDTMSQFMEKILVYFFLVFYIEYTKYIYNKKILSIQG